MIIFKIGDLVSRNKYNNDIVFRISSIEDNNIQLIGNSIRLIATSEISDLKIEEIDKDYERIQLIRRDKIIKKYISGKVLHIDGDENYLEQCKILYKKAGIFAKCIHIPEHLMKYRILELIETYTPDTVVITGHDVYNKKGKRNINNYMNSKYFVETTKEIRKQYSYNDIIIIAGACQSNFEALVANGANFASSPERINIHAYDPAIIAIKVSNTSITKLVNMDSFINYTYAKREGLGGIETYGKLRFIL